MRRHHTLHLLLNLNVGGVDIIKLLLTARTQVGLFLGIEILVEMKDGTLAAEIETQVVPGSITPTAIFTLAHIVVQKLGIKENG